MISYIKTFLSRIDLAQLLLSSLLLKLLITSSVSYAEALIVVACIMGVSFKYYVLNVKLKPLSEDTKKELQDIKTKVNKLESESRQAQSQVKPPTQRIWG